MPAIEFTNISKTYNNKIVLNDISLNIPNSEIFGLIGLNGIGKTTLLKVFLGLNIQDKGKIHSEALLKKKMVFLPEKFNPSGFLTGEEFLKISLGLHKQKYNPTIAETICKDLDFAPHELKNQISKYSKGMSQKLGLVSVFMVDADLIVLDEPMSGLDPRARIYLKKKMLQIKNAGKTIFFSSHIISDIEEICQMVAIIHDGKIYFCGKITDLLQNQNLSLEEKFLNIIKPQ